MGFRIRSDAFQRVWEALRSSQSFTTARTRETTFAFANNVSLDAPNPVAGSNVTAILAEMVVSSTRVKTSSGDSPTKLDLTTCTFGAIAKVDPGAVKKGNTWGRDFPGLLFRVLGFGARQGVLQL